MNHGIRSSRVSDWVAGGLDYAATYGVDYHPQVCLIELGMNDLAAGSWTTFRTNMLAIIAALRADGIVPVVLGIMPVHGGSAANKATRDTWNKNLLQMCVDCDELFIDIGKAVANPADTDSLRTANPDYYSSGVHLNSAGYKAIAKMISGHVIGV